MKQIQSELNKIAKMLKTSAMDGRDWKRASNLFKKFEMNFKDIKKELSNVEKKIKEVDNKIKNQDKSAYQYMSFMADSFENVEKLSNENAKTINGLNTFLMFT